MTAHGAKRTFAGSSNTCLLLVAARARIARVALCDINCPDSVVTEIRAVGGIAIGGKVDVTDATAITALKLENREGALGALVEYVEKFPNQRLRRKNLKRS
jgi:hypothetical protein